MNSVPAHLVFNSYGKSSVRLTKVRRLPDRHELVEMNLKITLEGDFDRSYTHGDNSTIVATDSMKNAVYVLAKTHPMSSPESFSAHLAEHFVKSYSQVSAATVMVLQSAWRRIMVDGIPHPAAFESGGDELRSATARIIRANGLSPEISGGLQNLMILKTTDSAFVGFVRDRFTTLPESTDRILATRMSADWKYATCDIDYNQSFSTVRRVMLETFARHQSLAVQQTLFAMGEAVLAAVPAIGSISLLMPNKHRIPFNFKSLGLEFENDVYVTTDEPSGEISATLRRGN